MSHEHHARVLGMALLFGDLSFQDLVGALEAFPLEPNRSDLERLLERLQSQGILTPERRLELHAQVADLERILEGASRDDRSPEPTLDPTRPSTAMAHPATPPPSDAQRTPSGRPSATQPRTDGLQGILSALTLPRWNTFINLRFIGEGGMGRIFRAFDPELNRPVALKFLRSMDPQGVAALVREARAQARVDHPNICKVFEVKEWQGQIYIVMQFIDGETLDRMAPLLSLEQKVELVERVADAIHAAHRQGLIHRDLKPTNIMVRKDPDGTLTPFVLDFGLARDIAQGGQTHQGTLLGTPHYMAPEQARGDTEHIDRRTDVYALGVTLYELLTGAPPFAAYQGMECLRHILEDTPRPLRAMDPALPLDLQTIVMKCLEKDPSLRYGSARALAEDLRRFRDDEPILARPATVTYRLKKYAQKNRPLVLSLLLVLVALLALAGMGLQSRINAASLARWAQRYGQEAERIEALLRYVRLQPAHDVREELNKVRIRIHTLERELALAPARAQGPGHYALGRAYLALGDLDQALAHLDQAWTKGFRTPDVAYARGRALGQAYGVALESTHLIRNEALRQSRIQALEQTLREPAVALLRQGRGSQWDPPEFQEALLAFYDRDDATSLRLTRAAVAAAPWFYEARRLEADIHLDRARRAHDPDEALAHLSEADHALNLACRTAPSDPALWDRLTQRWQDELALRRRRGLPTGVALEALREACAQWQALMPDAPGPEARLAKGELELARNILGGLEEPALLTRSIARAEALHHAHPDDAETLGTLALGLQIRAYRNQNLGQDPRPDLERALALLQRALDLQPGRFELCDPLVACHWALVEFEKSRGHDPEPRIREALKAIHPLAERFPNFPDFQGYLGGLLVEQVDFQATHGQDPRPTAQRALSHLKRAIASAPNRFEFHFSLGNAHLALAQFQNLQGNSPDPDLHLAQTAYERALVCNPRAHGAKLGLEEARWMRAQFLDAHDRDPRALLAQIETNLPTLLGPTGGWRGFLLAAHVARLQARWTPSPDLRTALLRRADQFLRRALQEGGRNPETLLAAAHITQLQARPSSTQEVRQLLDEALRMDPRFEPALRFKP